MADIFYLAPPPPAKEARGWLPPQCPPYGYHDESLESCPFLSSQPRSPPGEPCSWVSDVCMPLEPLPCDSLLPAWSCLPRARPTTYSTTVFRPACACPRWLGEGLKSSRPHWCLASTHEEARVSAAFNSRIIDQAVPGLRCRGTVRPYTRSFQQVDVRPGPQTSEPEYLKSPEVADLLVVPKRAPRQG